MSIIRAIKCDGCATVYVSQWAIDAKGVRQELRGAGWALALTKGNDLCARCVGLVLSEDSERQPGVDTETPRFKGAS